MIFCPDRFLFFRFFDFSPIFAHPSLRACVQMTPPFAPSPSTLPRSTRATSLPTPTAEKTQSPRSKARSARRRDASSWMVGSTRTHAASKPTSRLARLAKRHRVATCTRTTLLTLVALRAAPVACLVSCLRPDSPGFDLDLTYITNRIMSEAKRINNPMADTASAPCHTRPSWSIVNSFDLFCCCFRLLSLSLQCDGFPRRRYGVPLPQRHG